MAAAGVREGEPEDDLLAVFGIQAAVPPPEFFECAEKRKAGVVDDLVQGFQGLGIEHLLLQLRVAGFADGTHRACVDLAFVRTAGVAGCLQGQAGIHAECAGLSGYGDQLLIPVHVSGRFLQVTEQLFVDDILVGLRHIDGFLCDRLEACGNFSINIEKVGIEQRAGRHGFSVKGSHLGPIVDIAVGLKVFDADIRSFDSFVVTGKQLVLAGTVVDAVRRRLPVAAVVIFFAVRCQRTDLHIRICAVPVHIVRTVGSCHGVRTVDAVDSVAGQGIIGIDGHVVVGGLGCLVKDFTGEARCRQGDYNENIQNSFHGIP